MCVCVCPRWGGEGQGAKERGCLNVGWCNEAYKGVHQLLSIFGGCKPDVQQSLLPTALLYLCSMHQGGRVNFSHTHLAIPGENH